MEVTYTITLEDLLRYGEHLYRTSERAKRSKRAWRVFTPLFFACWAGYHYWQFREIDWVFILIAGQAVTSALFMPRMIDRLSLKAVYREFIARPERSDVGSLRLIVEPDAITEIGLHRQTKRRWAEVCRVEETDGYLYLFDSPKSAFIIPRRSFAEGQAYEELRRQIFEYAKINAQAAS